MSIVSQSLPTVSGALSVLGFENSKEWGVSSGTVTTSNQTTQGAASLGVSSFYYTELTSIPLSSLPNVGPTAAFDFRAASALGYGTAQLILDAPSIGLNMRYIGQGDLAGSAANTFRTVSFAVPPDVVTALRGQYNDLRIKITVNGPFSAIPYVFDNFRFTGG